LTKNSCCVKIKAVIVICLSIDYRGIFIVACLLVPATEAVITTVIAKTVKTKENGGEGKEQSPFLRRLNWLNTMLWGGSFLLLFEHIWHGEISPIFPFLTAASSPDTAAIMLREMATSGTAMSLLVTGVWALMVLATSAIEKKAESETVTAS
jgi:hypothetical protein